MSMCVTVKILSDLTTYLNVVHQTHELFLMCLTDHLKNTVMIRAVVRSKLQRVAVVVVVEQFSTNPRVRGLIPGSSWLHVKVFLDKKLTPCSSADMHCLAAVPQEFQKGDQNNRKTWLLVLKLFYICVMWITMLRVMRQQTFFFFKSEWIQYSSSLELKCDVFL